MNNLYEQAYADVRRKTNIEQVKKVIFESVKQKANKRKKCPGCGSTRKPLKRGTPCGESFTICPKCNRMRTATWLRRKR